MTNIDHVTNQLSENELAAVSGGMMMVDPIDAGGAGAWAAGGPAGYLIYQGGVGVGLAIKDWWRGRGGK